MADTYHIQEEDQEHAYSFLSSLPPGFQFQPHDHELILHYLAPKINNNLLPTSLIYDINIYNHTPDFLAATKRAQGGKMWYFFTPRDRRCPNGKRPNRKADDGYWKATGSNKPIVHHGVGIGFKQVLAYYRGKPPNGVKTSWLMQEFTVSSDTDRVIDNRKRGRDGDNISMRLDDYVLCRIYQSPRATCKKHNHQQAQEEEASSVDNEVVNKPQKTSRMYNQEAQQQQFFIAAVPPAISSYNTTTTTPNTYYCDQIEPSTGTSTNVGTCQSSFQSSDDINIADPNIYCSDQVETSVTCSTNVGTNQYCFQSSDNTDVLPLTITASYNTTKPKCCCSNQREQAVTCSTSVGTSQYCCQSSDSTHIVPPVFPRSNIEKAPVASCSSTNSGMTDEKYYFKSSDSKQSGDDLCWDFGWDFTS